MYIYKECVQFLDVSVSVDNSGNITTDLYVKPTDTNNNNNNGYF